MDQINERSTAYLKVAFRDKVGAPQAPSSAHYRIEDVSTGAVVRDDTSVVSLGVEIELVLTPDDNTLLSTGNRYETRRVTLTALYGADDQIVTDFTYRVNNLAGVS